MSGGQDWAAEMYKADNAIAVAGHALEVAENWGRSYRRVRAENERLREENERLREELARLQATRLEPAA